MSAKQKILIISGITGIGKSDLAIKLARTLQTDIIVGDSLQIYKNFPIASNFPEFPSDNDTINYHFLGKFDVLKERISAFQYRELLGTKIQEMIGRNKVPLIEGGCGFYLKYAMSSNDEYIDEGELKEAGKKARDIIENKCKRDWEQSESHLLKLCPSAQNFVPRNDYYRLEKALKYAIASKGLFFKARERESQNDRFQEIYDVRGFFLMKNVMDLYGDIQTRCDVMVERGLVEEVFEFLKSLNTRSLEGYDTMPIPLGYKEATEFINELIDINETKRNHKQMRYRLIREALLKFASKFQVKTRLIGTYNDKSKTKYLKATPLHENFEKAFATLNSGILRALGLEHFEDEKEFFSSN